MNLHGTSKMFSSLGGEPVSKIRLTVQLTPCDVAADVMRHAKCHTHGLAPIRIGFQSLNQIPGDRLSFDQVPERVMRIGEIRLQHHLDVRVGTSDREALL